MFILKVVIYGVTILAAMLFGFWELRLKEQLTDSAVQPSKMVSDFGAINLSERLKREEILRGLPKETKSKYRKVVMFKFLFVAMLIAEVIIFQR